MSYLDEPSYECYHNNEGFSGKTYAQNFDFGGFIPLIEETYQSLRTMNTFMRLPFSLFQHVMVNELHIHILNAAKPGLELSLSLQVALTARILPKSIFDYISHVSNAITQNGVHVHLNLPPIAVPQGPTEDVPSGSFGVVDERTHNVYECYISPLVTANRVIASKNNDADYQPLPPSVFPPELVPTRNLLGYGEIDQGDGTQECLHRIDFPNDDSILGRLKIDNNARHQVYKALSLLEREMKMVRIHKENPSKIVKSNGCFVESLHPVTNGLPLFVEPVKVYSNGKFNSATANQASIECMHRRRVATGENAAPGPCYSTKDGSTPPGWAATCNDNFEMRGQFKPESEYFDCPEMRTERFIHFVDCFPKSSLLQQFISRNYLYE